MKTHKLKLHINFCDEVLSGTKTFEIRYNDREFQNGDLITFFPWDPENNKVLSESHEITNHTYRIKYILNGWGLKKGYVALAIEDVRHGKWKGANGTFECSNCGYSFENEGYMHFFYFCPCCGARMDGEM